MGAIAEAASKEDLWREEPANNERSKSVSAAEAAGTAAPEEAADKTRMPGAFFASLKRNNRQIREDRALAIAETAQMRYRRKVEDLELALKQLVRDRENMLDLSPTNAQSLVVASDFDAEQFVTKDVNLGLKIRETEIMLEIARKQYNRLFEVA